MNILQRLAQDAQQKKQQLVNSIANIGQAPHPVNTAPAQVVQKIQTAKYGVLAHNPQNQQTAIRQLQAPVAPRPSIATGLSNAGDALNQSTMRTIVQPFVTRPAMEVAQTARQAVTHKPSTYTPGSPAAQALFGNAPVASIQKKVGDQYSRQSTSSNPLLRIMSRPLAVAEGVASVANDIPVVGGVAKAGVKGLEKVAPKAIPATKVIAKDVNAGVKAAQARVGTNEAVTAQQKQLQREIASHTKQRDALPLNNHKAAEVLQRKIDTKQGQIANLEASRPQQNIIQKGTDRVLSAQPGMSMKAVNPELPKKPTPPSTTLEVPFNKMSPELQAATKELWGAESPAELARAQAKIDAIKNGTVASTTPAPAQPKPSGKAPLPASTETGAVSLPNDTPIVIGNRLTKGAQAGRQNISAETQALTQGEHNVRSTKQLADTSAANVDKLPTNTAIEQAHNTLAQPLGHVTDEQTGFVAKTIEKADAEATKARLVGNTVEADRLSREAAALHDGLSEHAVARGQANQALTMLYNRSPQGLYHSAIRDLGRAGVEVKPELQAKLQGLVDAIKTAPDQATKADAIGTFHKAVSDTMPQNIGDKAIGIWKAGLLSGVKTQQGNAISNATFGALKKASDVPATAVDKLMSVFTGKRTKTLTGRGIGQGTAEGTRNAKYTLKTGIDRRGAGDKYEQHAEINFKNPVLNKTLGTATRTIFRGMNAADQPFWYAAFKNSMYDQAKAAAIDAKVPFGERKAFMEKLVNKPTDAMANTALAEANKSTLNYDTLGSKAVQGMHTAIDKFPGATKQGKAVAHGVLNVLAPFVRVPTAFLSRTVDFTPMGVGKEIFHQVASGKFDQRAMSQAIGEGLTGTGAIALGVALTQHNMLSGDYPKNDPKEVQRWKAEGITPNSVKLGGKWVSLNYLGPLGLLFNAGNKIENAKGQGATDQAGQAVAGFGQGLMGQSFLQGFSGFSNAIQDPQRNLKSFVNSQAGSVVPNIVNDAANATDSMQRQANNSIQTIQSRIPGARHGLPVKQDVYGNPLKQPAGPLGTLIGVKPSNSLTANNAVTSEVGRLHGVDPNNADLQVTPTPVTSVTIPGANKGDKSTVIKLNDKQKYAIQKQVGQSIQTNWGKLIQTPEYKAMSDTDKAKALTNMRTDTTELATRKYVIDNNLGSYSKSASKAAISLAGGDLSKYTDGKALSIPKGMNGNDVATLKRFDGMKAEDKAKVLATEPDAEYKLALANYERDKKLGTKTQAELQNEEASVAKAQVGAQFPKEVRDVYGLSASKRLAYLANHKDGNNLANAVVAYGDALAQNGIEDNATVDSKGRVKLVPKGTVIESSSPRISQVAQKNGIPDNIFAALVRQESGGNQAARSQVGAIGLTQLMPDTAKSLGVDPTNADQNLDGGARYLKSMYDKFGNWPLALAAYNAGPAAVEKYKGIPPFEETQNYVKSIMGMVNGGIKGTDVNLILNDPNYKGGGLNQSGVDTGSTASGTRSLTSRIAAFKTPYDNVVKSRTKGASLARNAKLAKKA